MIQSSSDLANNDGEVDAKKNPAVDTERLRLRSATTKLKSSEMSGG